MGNILRRKQRLTCAQVAAHLRGQRDVDAQAARDHLAACDACRAMHHRAHNIDAQLFNAYATHRPALSYAAVARIEAQLDRRLRREYIMQRTSQSITRTFAIVAILVIAVGVIVLLQGPTLPVEVARTQTSFAAAPQSTNTIPTPQANDVAESEITITFATYDFMREAYAALAQQFEQESGIHVELVSMEEIVGNGRIGSSDNIRQIASNADTFPVQLDKSIIDQNVLFNLTPLMDADRSFDRNDFYPAAFGNVQIEGNTWAIPSTFAFDMIAFDKEAFDQAGIPYPQAGWDWDDFLSKAQALTQRDGDDVTRWGYAQPFLRPFHIVAAYANLSGLDQTELRLDLAPIADALRWYTDLALQHRVAPLELLLDDGNVYNIIESGRAAMWDSFLGEARGTSIGVAPYPTRNDDERNAQIYLSSYAMSAGTQNPQASWRWLLYLSRHLPADSNPTTALPARQSLAAQIGFWDHLDAETTATYQFILDHANTRLRDMSFSNALRDAASAVLQGTSVEQALVDAQATHSGQTSVTSEPSEPVVVATALPPGEGDIVLRFIYQIDLLNQRPYDTLAREFNGAHPGVRVVPRENPLNDPTFADLSEISDCFVWPHGWESLDIDKLSQYALNLEPFIDADPAFPFDDFYPIALEVFRTQGDLWAIPAEFKPASMIQYNKNVFDAAGLDYPQPGWTLDEFRNMAVALTDAENDRYGFLSLSPIPDLTMEYIFAQANGAFYFSDDRDPPRPLFDDPKTIEALQWYVDLVNLYGVDRVAGEDPHLWWLEEFDWTLNVTLREKREALVRRGQVAMWYGLFLEHYPQSVAPAPLNEGGYIRGFFEGFYISASTPYPQLCWEWLRFISDRSAQYVRYGPVSESGYAAPEYAERVGREYADTMRFSLEHTVLERADEAAANQIGIQQYGPWFGDASRAAYLQEQDLAIGLAQVQDKVEALILCLDNRDGFGDEEIQKECALQVDS
jgi:ABC-type glycerol-3-phosphate transport system substrate-binding protein